MDTPQDIQKRYMQHQIDEEKRELAENAELINSFKQICAAKGVSLSDSNFTYIQSIGIVASFPNLVGVLCSDFSKDKEDLIDFKFLSNRFEKRPFASGFLYADNFMLMAHPNFRRGHHPNANFSPRFIDLFWVFNKPEIDSYISIDYNRVRINVDNRMYMEADTWYGAAFNKEIGSIKDDTVKLRPPSDIEDFIVSFCFADAYSLDVKWETKNGIKSFQSEEFKTESQTIKKDGEVYHPVRYVHAEFDLEKNHFRHFDGAIHFYTSEEYFARRDSDFNYNSKNDVKIKTRSEKLFKMNGNINVDTWIEFTSHFHTGNPLVIEYFEGKYPDNIQEMLQAVRKNKEK
jgi:hypothetical protein